MAVKLSKHAYDHAQRLIKDGKYVLDEGGDWSEHQPSGREENEFIEQHGFDEHQKWYLGEDDEAAEGTKARYTFPLGDFENVHHRGLRPPIRGPGSTSTPTSSQRPLICMGCWTH